MTTPPLNSGILILAHLYLSALLLVLPICRLISPTTLWEGLTAPWEGVHHTELLHEQITTVFASGWLGTSTIRGDSTKSVHPPFCKIGLLTKSEATRSVCFPTDIPHYRQVCLSGSPLLTFCLRPSVLCQFATLYFWSRNLPHQSSVRIKNVPASYSHYQSP